MASTATPNAQTLTHALRDEKLISLAAAAKLVPGHRANANVNASTVWRWICKGAKTTAGAVVKLEAVRIGQRWLTSREALDRFIQNLTDGSTGPTSATPPTTLPITSPSARARRAEAATNELDQLLGTGTRSAA